LNAFIQLYILLQIMNTSYPEITLNATNSINGMSAFAELTHLMTMIVIVFGVFSCMLIIGLSIAILISFIRSSAMKHLKRIVYGTRKMEHADMA